MSTIKAWLKATESADGAEESGGSAHAPVVQADTRQRNGNVGHEIRHGQHGRGDRGN